MNKRMNMSIVLCALLLCTSCGSSNSEASTTTLPIKVAVETLQTTKTTETTPETVMKKLTPVQLTDNNLLDIPNNVEDTIDLSIVNVNNNWLSIKEMNLDSFINGAGIKRCSWSTISNNNEELYFVGNGYGITETSEENNYNTLDDPTSFNGTLLGIECSLDSEVVEIIDDSNVGQYNIKAVMSSSDNTKNDYEILYYNGVKVGMTRNEVVSLLGEGTITNEKETITTTIPTTEIIPETKNETPIVTTAPVSTVEPLVTTIPSNSETTTVPETSVVAETVFKAEAGFTENIDSETIETETPTKKKSTKAETEEVKTTTIPELTTEITTTTYIDPYENYTANMYFKNTNNTLVIIFEDGKVKQIFLYNNVTEKAVSTPIED